MTDQSRVQRGVPAGGQFATSNRDESGITLAQALAGDREGACDVCGGPMRIDYAGVSVHTDEDGQPDFDADGDHTALNSELAGAPVGRSIDELARELTEVTAEAYRTPLDSPDYPPLRKRQDELSDMIALARGDAVLDAADDEDDDDAYAELREVTAAWNSATPGTPAYDYLFKRHQELVGPAEAALRSRSNADDPIEKRLGILPSFVHSAYGPDTAREVSLNMDHPTGGYNRIRHVGGFSTTYFRGSSLHREDGPAMVYPDGSGDYYLHGKQLAEPGLELRLRLESLDPRGTQRWADGRGHTADVDKDGTTRHYYDGVLHRAYGPAVITADGEERYYRDGVQKAAPSLPETPDLDSRGRLVGSLYNPNLPVFAVATQLVQDVQRAIDAGHLPQGAAVNTALVDNRIEIRVDGVSDDIHSRSIVERIADSRNRIDPNDSSLNAWQITTVIAGKDQS